MAAAAAAADEEVVDESNRSSSACNGGMKSKVCGDGNETGCGDVGIAAGAVSGVDETFCCCNAAETGDLEVMARWLTDVEFTGKPGNSGGKEFSR